SAETDRGLSVTLAPRLLGLADGREIGFYDGAQLSRASRFVYSPNYLVARCDNRHHRRCSVHVTFLIDRRGCRSLSTMRTEGRIAGGLLYVPPFADSSAPTIKNVSSSSFFSQTASFRSASA